ncbi:hypothetical protein FW320_06130 [Azospirillum sp. Vi22]|nr:hypothetical protein [Azospirillum baldaniorum]
MSAPVSTASLLRAVMKANGLAAVAVATFMTLHRCVDNPDDILQPHSCIVKGSFTFFPAMPKDEIVQAVSGTKASHSRTIEAIAHPSHSHDACGGAPGCLSLYAWLRSRKL